jgi:hypothetical protein
VASVEIKVEDAANLHEQHMFFRREARILPSE